MREYTPSSEVPRRVDVSVNAGRFCTFLDAGTVDDPATPVRVLFTTEGASIWTTNQTRTLQVFIDRWDVVEGLPSADCVMLVNPKELSDMLKNKFGRDELVRIQTDVHKPIEISGESSGGASIMPSDEDECLTIPDRWVLPIVDGVRTFPMFRNEPDDHIITMSIDQLRRGLKDMTTAKAPYIEYTWSSGKAKCEAGHWTSKTSRSWSDVDFVAVKGADNWSIRFTDNLRTIIRRFDPATETVTISKHRDGQFVIIDSTDGEFTSVLATEAVRE